MLFVTTIAIAIGITRIGARGGDTLRSEDPDRASMGAVAIVFIYHTL